MEKERDIFVLFQVLNKKKETTKIVDQERRDKSEYKEQKTARKSKNRKEKRHKSKKKVTILFFVGATDIQDYLIVVVALAWHLLVGGYIDREIYI